MIIIQSVRLNANWQKMKKNLDLLGYDCLRAHDISDVYGVRTSTVQVFVPYLNTYCNRYEINTPIRIAAFLAQIGHESGRFAYLEEVASGRAYEGRKDLGNTQPGDGVRYKGRGLIQLTGKSNYMQLSKDVGIDFVAQPELLSLPEFAVMSACWYWNKHKLNSLADKGLFRDITKKINGGYNGLEDREKLYVKCKEMMHV